MTVQTTADIVPFRLQDGIELVGGKPSSVRAIRAMRLSQLQWQTTAPGS